LLKRAQLEQADRSRSRCSRHRARTSANSFTSAFPSTPRPMRRSAA